MSLITPQHLYDIPPAVAAAAPTQVQESARPSLFEEAWLQLPRRRVGEVVRDATSGNAHPTQGEGHPRA